MDNTNTKVIALPIVEVDGVAQEQVYRFPTYAPVLDAQNNPVLDTDGNPIQAMDSYEDKTISEINGCIGSLQAIIDKENARLALIAALPAPVTTS